MTEEMLFETVDTLVKVCKRYKDYGFDGVFQHAANRFTLLGRSLSPASNHRTDRYGGSLENRCRLPFFACDEIKKACGKDFIIEMSITGEDKSEDGRWMLDDTVKFTKLAEGHADIVQLRTADMDYAVSTGFEIRLNTEAEKEELKNSHYDVIIAAIGAKPVSRPLYTGMNSEKRLLL